ncbi:Protein CBG13392 [Caenorhabditis briggsae]|uniref:Protein CBG13392 n=1 Tax=Caenorhabditis briggsae TaxID=6238 RepID=A8XHV6_CAEBR|nr:Protein CBG13392 [Caenorhabditis briggsae]CAP32222.2 Protein CBG13392 [Caenorhabditis briggsae]
MRFQNITVLFIFSTVLAVSYADTLIRSLPVQEARRNHLKELINAHKQKIAEQKRTIVVFDENEPKKIKQDRSIIVFKEQEAPKEIEKKRSIVVFDQPIQEVKHREDKKTMLLGFKNGKATNQRETKNRVDRKTVLLGFKNGELPKADGNVYVAKDKEDRRYVGTILKNGEAGQKNVAAAKDREDRRYVGTILKNGEAGQEEVKQREDRKTVLLGFRNGEAHPVKHREDKTRLMITLKNGKAAPHPQEAKHREDKRKIIVFKNGEGDKRAQNDALLNALGERYNHLKVAKRDTLIRSLPVAEKKEQQSLAAAKKKDSELSKNFMEALKAYPNRGTDKEKAAFAAKRREAIRDFLKNRRAIFKQTRYGDWPGFPRKKRDIAATVVGAAVSSVVSNLMKNVEESVVQAESEAAKQVQADLDSDQGRILGQGDFQMLDGVQADVEVIVGNTNATTTTTTAPAGEKKGFFATLFNSFKLFFGTVTNSVGGFFIDVGSRITNFVEKRIKV